MHIIRKEQHWRREVKEQNHILRDQKDLTEKIHSGGSGGGGGILE